MGKSITITLILIAGLLAACGSAEYESVEPAVLPEQTVESAVVGEADEAESPTNTNDCLPHEAYDAETDTCYVDISCETEEACDDIIATLYDGYDVDLEYWDMIEEECLPGESYDPEEAICYIECDTDEECQALADEIYSGLDVYFDETFGGHPGQHGEQIAQYENGDEPPPIARYRLNDSLDLTWISISEDETNPAYNNPERHQEIWLFTRRILPKNVLKNETREYHIFTDGPEETLAYVSPLPDDPHHWLFAVDIEDAGVSGSLGKDKEFIHTIIHEFAHIVTLESDQVPPDLSSAPEEEGMPSQTELTCNAFFTGEGCAKEQSYINLFFERFWSDIYDELDEIYDTETDEDYDELSYMFYQKYQDRFVTEYAATNPGEDIAESFTFFILKDKPTGDTIAEQKVRFFYAFEPLIQMRNQIRSQLARINPG